MSDRLIALNAQPTKTTHTQVWRGKGFKQDPPGKFFKLFSKNCHKYSIKHKRGCIPLKQMDPLPRIFENTTLSLTPPDVKPVFIYGSDLLDLSRFLTLF